MKLLKLAVMIAFLALAAGCKKAPEPPAGEACQDHRECFDSATTCICDDADNLIYQEYTSTGRNENTVETYTYDADHRLLSFETHSASRNERCTLNNPCEMWPEPGPAYDPACMRSENLTCEEL